MKISKGLFFAATVALLTTAYGQSADAHIRNVKVYRGAEAAEVVPVVGQKARKRARVLKGEAAESMTPIPAGLSYGGSQRRDLVAGERLWLVDQTEGEVVGCRISKHLLWDLGPRIRCIKGDLPD